MTLTLALTLGFALSGLQQTPAAGSLASATPVAATPAQAQQPVQPAEPKPAGTTGTTPVAPPPITSPQPATAPQEPQAITRSNEAVVLLERIETLLGHTESDARELKSAGKVTLNRADLDEVVAELKQLKTMLQK